jgi:WG containing repeat
MIKQHLILILFINMSVFAQNIVNEKLIPFHNKEGKWGYLDADSDKVIIPAKYDFANLFENGTAVIGNKNPNSKTRYEEYLSGYIRENGEEILPINFTGIYDVKTQMDSIFRDFKNITFENGINGILKLPEGKWLIELGKYKDFQFYKPNQYLADNIDFYDGDKKYSAPIDCEIKRIDFENRLFYITKGEKEPNEGICTWEGKIIIEPKYIDVKYVPKTKTFLASTILGKITLKNIENKIIDNFLFDVNGTQIVTFKSKKIPFIRENESIGRYELNNKELTIDLASGKLIEDSVEDAINKQTVFQNPKTKLFGLKDETGKIKIQPTYAKLEIITKNSIIAEKESGYPSLQGLFDNQGKQITDFIYEELSYSEGKLIGKKNKKYGALDFNGKEIIEFKYNYNYYFDNGLANVHTDTGEGVIDGNGNEVIQPVYKTIFRQEIEDKILLADPKFNYQKTTFLTAEKDKKWGMFDTNGKLIIPIEYGSVNKEYNDKYFLEGWINISDLKRENYGLINIYTNVNIPPIYSSIKIYDGYLIANNRVENNYTYKLLNLKGQPISDISYDKMDLKYDYFIVSKDKQEGIMNQKGEIIVPLKFNYIWAESQNLIRIWDNESYYYINVKTGKEYKLKE